MKNFNFEKLIGKNLLCFRSGFCRVAMYNNKVETHLDYKSMAIFSMNNKKDAFAQAYLINSYWNEIENGGDDFSISVELFGEPYKWLTLEDKYKEYPSSLSISEFTVAKIDIYGYNINFNLVNPTKHIVKLKSLNGQELLIKPDGCGMGLLVSQNVELNMATFEKSPQSEYIYHVERYE